MIQVIKQGGQDRSYVFEAAVDTVEDIQDLPSENIYMGSTCIVIEDSSVYMLGSDGWHELQKGGREMGLSVETYALVKKYTDAKASKTLQDAKEYAEALVSQVSEFKIKIVDSLPTEDIDLHTIYFIKIIDPFGKDNGYYEYMYIENKWELIGSTDFNIENYYTKEEIDKLFEEKQYVLPVATTETLGGVKIDDTTIKIDDDGAISIDEDNIKSISQEVVNNTLNSDIRGIPNEEIDNLFK